MRFHRLHVEDLAELPGPRSESSPGSEDSAVGGHADDPPPPGVDDVEHGAVGGEGEVPRPEDPGGIERTIGSHRVERGDILLVHAAAGGVGLLLCQWAKHLGATVIGTVSTVDKARFARAAGCDYPIVGAMDEFAGRVMEITRGHGADVIYDGIGKASFAGSFEALALRGHLVLYGQATGIPDPISHTMLAEKSATVTRPVLFHYTAEPESLTDMARNLFGMIESGTLKVSINQRFTLRDAAQAHRELEGRRTTGSTILLP